MKKLVYAFQNKPADSSDYKGNITLWLLGISFTMFIVTMILTLVFDVQLETPWYEKAYNLSVYIAGTLCAVMTGIHIGYNLRAHEEK